MPYFDLWCLFRFSEETTKIRTGRQKPGTRNSDGVRAAEQQQVRLLRRKVTALCCAKLIRYLIFIEFQYRTTVAVNIRLCFIIMHQKLCMLASILNIHEVGVMTPCN